MGEQNGLQDHLNKGMYGTPQIKPDEKRKYLGTFRERVALTMTFAEVKDKEYQQDLKQMLSQHPELRVIVNGQIKNPLLNELLQIFKQTNVQFTLNTDRCLPHAENDLAIVVCDAKKALHIDEVDICKLYPKKEQVKIPEQKDSKKEPDSLSSWFHHLFK